jgi:hypothetical protein
MSDDFLTRTAERALEQATVVRPVLASTYQAAAGFGLESEVTLATPWLAPPKLDPAALSPRPERAPATQERLPRPSVPEASASEPEAIQTAPEDDPAAPVSTPTARVELPPEDAEPTLSSLTPEHQPTGPIPAASPEVVRPRPEPRVPRAEPTLEAAEPLSVTRGEDPTPAEPQPTAAEPTLGSLEELAPPFEEPGAVRPAQSPRGPDAARSNPTAPRPPGRIRVDRVEPAAGREVDRLPEPTLDATPAAQPTTARIGATDAIPSRPDSPAHLSLSRPSPSPNRRLDGEPQQADVSSPVHVTIGRVEIRGDAPAPTPPAPTPSSRPALPLDEYLRTRGGIA